MFRFLVAGRHVSGSSQLPNRIIRSTGLYYGPSKLHCKSISTRKPHGFHRKSNGSKYLSLAVSLVGGSSLLYFYFLSGSSKSDRKLNKDSFTTNTITSVTDISSDLLLLTVSCFLDKSGASDAEPGQPHRALHSVQVKHPDLQIGRSYTPLPWPPLVEPKDADARNCIRLLIRKEPGGEVSGYLHRLGVGDKLELRGFFDEFDLRGTESPGKRGEEYDEVVILAGGTGIATALQTLNALLTTRDTTSSPGDGSNNLKDSLATKPNPSIRVLWGVRNTSDWGPVSESDPKPQNWMRLLWGRSTEHVVRYFPPIETPSTASPAQELEAWKRAYPDQLMVEYLADEQGTCITPQLIKSAFDGFQNRIDESSTSISAGEKAIKRKLIIVSGPDGFVNHFAGAKQWEGGRLGQGALGGVLGRMGVHNAGWEVWKA